MCVCVCVDIRLAPDTTHHMSTLHNYLIMSVFVFPWVSMVILISTDAISIKLCCGSLKLMLSLVTMVTVVSVLNWYMGNVDSKHQL